jgi:CBS domain-containing protein
VEANIVPSYAALGGTAMLVRDVLRTKGRRLFVMGPEATVQEAVRCFVEHDIGSIPVVDNQGRPIGIFSERDVLFGFVGDCQGFRNSELGDVMTRDPICCSAADEIHDVMGKMSHRHVGQLPVLDDDGRVTGVVSVGDLVKYLHAHVESENGQLMAYIFGPTV